MNNSTHATTVVKRRWPWTVPALILGFTVVIWQGGIEKRSWCVIHRIQGDARIVEYTPGARRLLPAFALAAFLAAGLGLRRLLQAGVDRRDPAAMTMLCVLVAVAVLWLLQTHAIWADSLRIERDAVTLDQTQWLLRQSHVIPYRQLTRVSIGRHKWVFESVDRSAQEIRLTPLVRAGREDLLAVLGHYGVKIVHVGP